MMILLAIFGVSLIAFGIYSIIEKQNCKKQIQATFIRIEEIILKGVTNYTPVFRYEFQGKQYERNAFGVYKKKDVSNYHKEKIYTISINEKRPHHFVLHRKVSSGDVMAIGIGILFIVASYIGG